MATTVFRRFDYPYLWIDLVNLQAPRFDANSGAALPSFNQSWLVRAHALYSPQTRKSSRMLLFYSVHNNHFGQCANPCHPSSTAPEKSVFELLRSPFNTSSAQTCGIGKESLISAILDKRRLGHRLWEAHLPRPIELAPCNKYNIQCAGHLVADLRVFQHEKNLLLNADVGPTDSYFSDANIAVLPTCDQSSLSSIRFRKFEEFEYVQGNNTSGFRAGNLAGSFCDPNGFAIFCRPEFLGPEEGRISCRTPLASIFLISTEALTDALFDRAEHVLIVTSGIILFTVLIGLILFLRWFLLIRQIHTD